MYRVIFLVLNKKEFLDKVLTSLVEAGITGATIIDSMGMGHAIASDVPIFAGLRYTLEHSYPENVTIFAVVKKDEQVNKVIELIEEFLNLDEPGTGILFVLPVYMIKGLANEALSF